MQYTYNELLKERRRETRMQKSLCQPRRLLLCMRLRGIIPFWRRKKLIQGQSLVGFIFPTVCGLLCCARNPSVPQGSSIVVIPRVSQRRFWPGAWSRGNEEERDVALYLYMGRQSKKRAHFRPQFLFALCSVTLPSASKCVSRTFIS